MSINNNYPIVIPDPLDPNYGPSASNIPVVSGQPGSPPTIASIATGNGGLLYNITSDLLPQPSNGTNVYRFTLNMYLSSITVATPGNATILVFVIRADTTSYILAGQTNWVNASTSIGNPPIYYSLSALFMPQPGDSLRVIFSNSSGGTFTNVVVQATGKGNGIELVSTAATQRLIYS